MSKYLYIATLIVGLAAGLIWANAVVAAQLSVDLKVNNQDGTITVPDETAVTLTWSTQNATSCTASGAWSGARALGDSEVTVPLSSGTYTYTLDCTDGTIMINDSVTVIVSDPVVPPVATPSVDLKVNNQDGSITVQAPATVTLSWSTQDTTSCTASGDWAGTKTLGDSEVISLTVPNVTKTFTLTCTGAGGSDSDTVNVAVAGGGVIIPAPTLTFTANGSTGTVNVSSTVSATLAWTAANVTSCTASGDWTGTKSATSGSENVGPFAASSSKTFTLSCIGAGGSTSSTITVSTSGGSTVSLVISNVRVTDVTKNSAIVRWDTNLPANSRVIYDTTSHPDISNQSAPNYGYSSSTGTSDTTTLVTTHAVTVTGLSANTKYYFRVISEN